MKESWVKGWGAVMEVAFHSLAMTQALDDKEAEVERFYEDL